MSTAVVALAWIGLAVGVVVLAVAVVLFNRVLRPIAEIERYARDILENGLGVAKNVDGVDEALRTRELATAVPGLAVRYLGKIGRA